MAIPQGPDGLSAAERAALGAPVRASGRENRRRPAHKHPPPAGFDRPAAAPAEASGDEPSPPAEGGAGPFRLQSLSPVASPSMAAPPRSRMQLSREILDRVDRVLDYHRAGKQSFPA